MATTQPLSQQVSGVSTAPYPITGLKTGFDGKDPPLRREIREMYNNSPEQFNLYLLALRAVQDLPFKDRLSYFQLAGIHGVPWTDWDGVTGREESEFWNFKSNQPGDDPNGGYCVHESILFPTWHRPYMLLFEQVLSEKMTEIAGTFRSDLKVKYMKAAETWRLPYWDWLALPDPNNPTTSLPDFISGYNFEDGSFNNPNIEVLAPNGTITVIANPLYSFKFDRGDSDFKRLQYAKNMNSGRLNLKSTRRGQALEQTLRTLKTLDGSTQETKSSTDPEQSTNGEVARSYNKLLWTAPSDLLSLLLQCNIYDQYSNKKFNTVYEFLANKAGNEIPNTVSIEKLHDLIHQSGGGFIALLQEAAFDPLFWLHHCNIDRWQAIWEAIHPGVPFLETKETWANKLDLGYDAEQFQPVTTSSSWFLKKNDKVDEDTDLKPFHRSTTRGDYWKSKHCRSLEGLGYNYTELVRQPGEKDEIFRDRLIGTVRTLYTYDAKGFDSSGWPGKTVDTNQPWTRRDVHRKTGETAGGNNMKMLEIPTDARKPLKAHSSLYRDAGPNIPPPKVPARPQATTVTAITNSVLSGNTLKSWGLKYRQFTVSMHVEQYSLNAGFGIYLFFGAIPIDAQSMFDATNRVGYMVVLANSPQSVVGCSNCVDQVQSRAVVGDSTDITGMLLDAADPKRHSSATPDLKDLTEASVVPYLKANLNWCIAQFQDDVYSIVDIKDKRLENLRVTVRSHQVIPPDPKKGELLPKLTDGKVHPEATSGKPGGFIK